MKEYYWVFAQGCKTNVEVYYKTLNGAKNRMQREIKRMKNDSDEKRYLGRKSVVILNCLGYTVAEDYWI